MKYRKERINFGKTNFPVTQIPCLSKKKEFEYSYCTWGTSVLFEIYPFDMERKGIKRGRKITKVPLKKNGKFQHFINEKNRVIAIYEYIDNYDLPAQYIFF